MGCRICRRAYVSSLVVPGRYWGVYTLTMIGIVGKRNRIWGAAYVRGGVDPLWQTLGCIQTNNYIYVDDRGSI